MAYSEELADRVRDLIFQRDGVTEKKMFGGVCWMVNGNMAVCAARTGLMVRLPPEDAEVAIAEPHVAPMEMKGRQMKAFVIVDEEVLQEDEDLLDWVDTGASYAEWMPRKK